MFGELAIVDRKGELDLDPDRLRLFGHTKACGRIAFCAN
jgi:hypothetical protein